MPPRAGWPAFATAGDRLYNPLPLFHVNASIFSFYCAMLRGNCQVQTDRFSPTRWWAEVAESRATVVHYLGVVVPMLLGQPPGPLRRHHRVRFAIGAGVDPQRHAEFEQRFGFPLVEIWGMTEMVRAMVDSESAAPGGHARLRPRRDRGWRCASSTTPGPRPARRHARRDAGAPLGGHAAAGLLQRLPRRPGATEQAWRGGWFHTGDIVTRAADGTAAFRRPAQEHHPPLGREHRRGRGRGGAADPPAGRTGGRAGGARRAARGRGAGLRGAAPEGRRDPAAAVQALFDHCQAEMAYYKAPGWLWLTDQIPTTSTQKVQKHQIFEPGIDPRALPGMVDLRARKRRGAA
jgi:acyl-CoA synthetase (AMP-forming)/AMP-acid ligase II